MSGKQQFFLILTLIILTLAYYFLGWRTYTNTSYGFSLRYPTLWSHTVGDNEYAKSMNAYTERWYVYYGSPSANGKSFNGEELFLYIYDSQNLAWKQEINEWDIMAKKEPDFFKKTTMNIGGKTAKVIALPTLLKIGPIEYKGRAYYFTGNNNETVKKILESFAFTK